MLQRSAFHLFEPVGAYVLTHGCWLLLSVAKAFSRDGFHYSRPPAPRLPVARLNESRSGSIPKVEIYDLTCSRHVYRWKYCACLIFTLLIMLLLRALSD